LGQVAPLRWRDCVSWSAAWTWCWWSWSWRFVG